ncbi:MAG: lysophospholipid acyltransferase family protein [Bryobacteraceae bacterium]|nr:lysophospholipid acyltransferase family protein [Bryobacteraceae bacterium]
MRTESTPAPRNRLFASALAETGLPTPVADALERVLLLDRLDDIYSRVVARTDDKPAFDKLLDILNIKVAITPDDLDHIPKTGPVVLVANHPFGFIEGAIVAAVLPRVRSDVKIMANTMLSNFGVLADFFLYVNPFGGENAARENRKGLRQAVAHLRNGGMLVVFPAGEVAHLDLRERGVVDPPWNPGVAGLARISGATVIPSFFAGANSALFQLLGFLHPRVRTAMLPHEFLNKQCSTIEFRIGSPIAPARLGRFTSDRDSIAWIRSRTYLLKHRNHHVPTLRVNLPFLNQPQEPVEPSVAPAQLAAEISRLQPERRLTALGELSVYYASSHEIPQVLREIGRLREITFRRAGEGTGKPLDIDPFDAHYIHLFIWNPESREIIGAYRVGESDRIRSRFGISGLYTSTLFRYDERFLDKLGTGLELGRSFVCLEHQKSYTPLMLLWRGISIYVCRYPRYSKLFGPVSISNDYTPISRQLMVSYFTQHDTPSAFSGLVQARNPLRRNPLSRQGNCSVWDIEDLSAAIADIEIDGKGLPVLLRQYLKLGGRLVGFNVDKQFSNALDGLIVVDLHRTDRKVLERYMGKTEAAEFLTAVGSGATG